jgi:tetratricopeptide (TPR) repeat protein
VESVTESAREVQNRPGGFPVPPDPRLVRARRALKERRIKDAEKLISSIGDDPDAARSAWTTLLSGLIALERSDLASAGPSLALAAFRAIQEPASGPQDERDGYRLAAWALEELGVVFRRQDHPEQAYRVHLEAYRQRDAHGSFDELWETAVSLGLDAHLTGNHEDAARWHEQAIELAEKTTDQAQRKQAVAWTHLASSLTAWGHHDDAVDAARRALEFHRAHDPAAPTAAQAEMNVGYALLKQGESLHDIDAEHAAVVLKRAINGLEAAHEALCAFGAETAADAQWCDEQLDFARRLLASLPG